MKEAQTAHTSILSWAGALLLREKGGLFISCMRSLVMAPVPLLIKLIVDEALEGGSTRIILGATLLSTGLIIVHYPLAVYGTKRLGATLQNTIANYRSRIFQRIQHISFGYLDTAATGKLISKYGFDTQKVHDSMLLIIAQLVPNAVYSVGVLGVLFYMNWALCLVTILLLPIFYIARHGFMEPYKVRNHEARTAQETLTGKAGELIASLRMVRSMGEDESAQHKINPDNDHAAITRFNVITSGAHFGTFMFVASQMVTLIVLATGAWLVLQGHVTTGVLIAFVAAMPQILMPVNLVSQLMEQLVVGNGKLPEHSGATRHTAHRTLARRRPHRSDQGQD